jgi:drug/metabolite transporter (DMT)-like permease
MNSAFAIAAFSSLLFGGGDFMGGIAARRAPAPQVTAFSCLAGLAVLAAAMPFLPGTPTGADLAWGAATGVCSAAGATLMYRALALGPMSLASPVFCVIGLAVPVVFGFVAGERPSPIAWAGVVLAALAIPPLAVTGEGPGHYSRAHVRRTLVASILAGLVIGWFLVLVSRIGPGAGLVPLGLARIVAIVILFGGYLVRGRSPLPATGARAPALAAGALDSGANVAYLSAVHMAPLVLVSALVSLAPAVTVLIARFVLGERWTVSQGVGLVMAVVAGVCISVG